MYLAAAGRGQHLELFFQGPRRLGLLLLGAGLLPNLREQLGRTALASTDHPLRIVPPLALGLDPRQVVLVLRPGEVLAVLREGNGLVQAGVLERVQLGVRESIPRRVAL